MKFLKFDRSRTVIFLILFLLFPMGISYPCVRGEILKPRSMVCLTAIDGNVLPAFIGIIEYFIYYGTELKPIPLLLINLVINYTVSFIVSYPINLVYLKKVRNLRKKSSS